MKRSLIAILATLPSIADAHEGAHLHPHGIQFGWIIACIAFGIAGYGLARWRK